MKLVELNEASKIITDGLEVYLDKKNNTFSLVKDRGSINRGLVTTITNKKDYDKLTRKYDLAVDQDWKEVNLAINSFKKAKKTRQKASTVTKEDKEMSKLLNDMQKDIMKMARKK